MTRLTPKSNNASVKRFATLFSRSRVLFAPTFSLSPRIQLWCGECSDSSKIKPCCTLTCPCTSCKWSSLTRQESTHPSGCPACSLPLTSDLAELKRCVLCRKWFHNKCAVWEDRLQKDLKGEYGRKQVDSRGVNVSSNVGRIVCYGCTVDKGLGGFGGWLKNGVGLEGGVEVRTL